MAEILNALTGLLRGKTPDEIYETLCREHCLSPAGIEQRAQGIALIQKATRKRSGNGNRVWPARRASTISLVL